MTDPRSPDTGGLSSEADHSSPPGMPRWAKVVGLVILVAALVLVAVLALGGGGHGPARHASTGEPGDTAPAAAALTGG